MDKKSASDTVVLVETGEQLREKAERSDHNRCEMCGFLEDGYMKAHSKQAKAEYGEGYIKHRMQFHLKVELEHRVKDART